MNPIQNVLNEFSYSYVNRILYNTPDVSKDEFINKLEVGDVIISQQDIEVTSKNALERFGKRIHNSILRNFQKQPYASCKMYVGNGMITGYGVNMKDLSLDSVDIHDWIKNIKRSCCIRINIASPEQKKRAAEVLNNSIGMKYKTIMLVSSMISRSFKNNDMKINPLAVQNEITPEEEEYTKRLLLYPNICSTIVAAAYYRVGCKIRFMGQNLVDIWPVDFIISSDCDKIMKFGGL